MAKIKRCVLRFSNIGHVARVFSIFPEDYIIVSAKRGLPDLPEYFSFEMQHDSFPEVNEDYYPISGHIREENGKIKITLDGMTWEEK